MIYQTPRLPNGSFDDAARLRSMSAPRSVSQETLVAPYGGDVMMPDPRHKIEQCPRFDALGSVRGLFRGSTERERSD